MGRERNGERWLFNWSCSPQGWQTGCLQVLRGKERSLMARSGRSEMNRCDMIGDQQRGWLDGWDGRSGLSREEESDAMKSSQCAGSDRWAWQQQRGWMDGWLGLGRQREEEITWSFDPLYSVEWETGKGRLENDPSWKSQSLKWNTIRNKGNQETKRWNIKNTVFVFKIWILIISNYKIEKWNERGGDLRKKTDWLFFILKEIVIQEKVFKVLILNLGLRV